MKYRLNVEMYKLLHPFTSLDQPRKDNIIDLYKVTFTGCDELSIDCLLKRDIYGIFIDGDLLAFVVFNGCILEYLAVKTSNRGKGIGSIVVYASVLLCKNKGYFNMYLECKEGLISYYKRFGAEEIKEDRRVVYNNGEIYSQMFIDIR